MADKVQTRAKYPETQLPSPPFKIRPAGKEDGPPIFRLLEEVLAEYALFPDAEGVDADLNDIDAAYHARGGCFYIVSDPHEELVGSVGLYPLDKCVCELRKMYVRKHCRGQGLGKFLMEMALAQARRLGFSTITLQTATVLKEAIERESRLPSMR